MKAERTIKSLNRKPRDREHEFTLVLSQIPELTASMTDALFEAGCDDATISMQGGRLFLAFARQAPTLQQAILSAIHDVRKSHIGADVLRVDDCSLVTQADIAKRIGRSRQLVHQYLTGARGAGKFPPPVCEIIDEAPLWYWCDVARWLVKNDLLKAEALRDAEEVEAINSVLDLTRQRHERSGLLNEAIRSLLPKKLAAPLLSALK